MSNPPTTESAGENRDVTDVGSSVSRATWVAIVFLATAILAGLWIWRVQSKPAPERLELRVSGGRPGGTYHALATAIASALASENVAARAIALESQGSTQNVTRLDRAEADIAFAQADAEWPDSLRLIADLYDETLHIVVRSELRNVDELTELSGLRVAVGAPDSGTRILTQRILDHFGIRVVARQVATDELAAGFRNKTLDAAFILTALPSQAVDRLCDQNLVRFVSMGQPESDGTRADALATCFPSLAKTVIPSGCYGRLPANAITTISLGALLVTRRDLDAGLVRDVAATLFDQRSQLRDEGKPIAAAARIRERYDPTAWPLPYHSGAIAHYERHQPSFMVEYAEPISLGLTVLAGLFSGGLAFRQWVRRRRKNRIDVYYNRVRALSGEIVTTQTTPDLVTLRGKLDAVLKEAFGDLVEERLDANESFTIFQDYLGAQIDAIDRRLEARESRGEKIVLE